MKRPSIVDIFGHPVTIQYTNDLDGQTDGEYIYKEKSIKIDASLKGNQLLLTILHECIHAYFDRLSLNQPIHSDVEEIIADTLPKMLIENFNIRPK